MKLLPILSILFIGIPVCAQLTVKPSAGMDHFIYAKDRLIYVEDQIDLQKNQNTATEASIYLRKDSQILQGEKQQNENKGNGSISVFQIGTSNSYQYNYWGFPVAVPPNGNYKITDFLKEPTGKTNYREAKLTAALDGTADPLSISSYWIYAFSGKGYSSWQFLGDHFDLKPGEGFSMKGVNDSNNLEIEGELVNAGNAQTYDFRGKPNDGEISLEIEKEQILLVGNPYPSALDLKKFLLENTDTTGIAYFWDSSKKLNSHQLDDYEGGYGIYSPGADLYLPPAFIKFSDYTFTGETGELIPRRISPIAQGFMVIGSANGHVTFNNSQRVYQKEYPKISVFKTSEEYIPTVILKVEMDSTYVRELGLALRNDSGKENDHAMDAEMFDEKPNEIAWDIDGKNFAINVRPFEDQELIPLNIYLKEKTILNFSIAEFRNFNPDRVFIYDRKDDLYFSIKTGYLKLELEAGDYTNRFFFTFLEKFPAAVNIDPKIDPLSLKPTNVLLNTVEIFQNNREERLEIAILYESALSNLRLYTINGRLVSNQVLKQKEKEFNLPTGNLSTGVYIVKVNTTDGKELTKKIEIKN